MQLDLNFFSVFWIILYNKGRYPIAYSTVKTCSPDLS